MVIESTDACIQRMGSPLDRLRFLGEAEPRLRESCHDRGVDVLTMPVVSQARFELLRVVREQSVSHAYHRYGNLGEREL